MKRICACLIALAIATPALSQQLALDQMVIAFEGNHSRSEIKTLLDEVMSMHGASLEEREYRRWGNVLVEMRRTTPGITEMGILRCIKEMGTSVQFPANAALCAVGLSKNR